MEIVSKGCDPQDMAADFECFHCKSVIRATRREGEVAHIRDLPKPIIRIACPVCKSINGVPDDQFKPKLAEQQSIFKGFGQVAKTLEGDTPGSVNVNSVPPVQ